jgi:hypothetical protein
MLWNMASAHELLGQPDEAIRNLTAFILFDEVSDSERRDAEARIGQIRERGRSEAVGGGS